jgi:hypothetical protein
VESHGFSAHRARLERDGELTDDDLVALQKDIIANPEAGDLVRGTSGLRKIRLGQRSVGRGKRGGARVLYIDLPKRGSTYLVAIFGKREKSDLTKEERDLVAAVVKRIKEEA